MSRHWPIVIVLLAAVAAPAAQEPPSAGGPTLVTGDALADYWVPERRSARAIADVIDEDGEPGCVAIAYYIASDGSTLSSTVLASEPPERYDDEARRLVSRLHYDAAEDNPDELAVTTRLDLAWGADGDAGRAREIAEPCVAAAASP